MHLPRKRNYNGIDRHRINKSSPTGGHSGPPLRREFGICSASDIRDNHGHHVRADTAVRPYAENLVSAAQAIFVKRTHHIRAGAEACPYESLYQVRFAIGKRQSTVINKLFSAQRGGMLSGRAASRTGQLSDTASQHTFGGWQGGHRPRWPYTSPRFEIITPAIGDGRPT